MAVGLSFPDDVTLCCVLCLLMWRCVQAASGLVPSLAVRVRLGRRCGHDGGGNTPSATTGDVDRRPRGGSGDPGYGFAWR